MLEPAVVVLRLMQYAGAMILMGSSLFFLYALPRTGPTAAAEMRWARKLLASAAGLLAAGAALGLAAQTSVMAGSVSEGLKLESLSAVATGMPLGKAALVRVASAALALLALLLLRPGRTSWAIAAGLGIVATASFPWMGHAAATEGPAASIHLISDVAHSLAAAVWIGALVAFFGLLRARPSSAEARQTLHRALRGFAGVGTALVAVLVATGLVNSWFLVGPANVEGLWTTAYGRLLALKILLFGGMLALAAANRFRLTPSLGAALGPAGDPAPALAALRRSVMIETAMGFAVLGLVAWFGTLASPAA